MREIVEVVSKISLASLSNILASLIRTKIFAIILGTIGIGLISQISNYITFILFFSSLGLPLGIIKYISEWESENNYDNIKEVVINSIILILLFSVIFIIITLIFSSEISFILLNNNTYFILILIATFSIPFSLVYSILESTLKGLKHFKLYVKLTVFQSIFNLLITITLVYYFDVIGFAVSMICNSIFNLVLYLFKADFLKLINFNSIYKLNIIKSKPFRLILRLGFVSLFVGVFEQLTNLFIRSMIVNNFSIEMNGIYQCVVGISNNYLVIFYMTLGTYIYPKLSGIKNDNEFNLELDKAFKITLLVIVPTVLITYIFREIVIIILYSSEFLKASELFIFSIIGDFFKALSWVIGSWLIPKSKLFLFVILALSNYFLYLTIIILLNYFYNNIENVVISYAITNFLYLIANYIIINKFNKFSFLNETKKIFFNSVFICSLLFMISNYSIELGYILFLPFLIIWLKLNVKLSEIKQFIKIYYN